MEHTPPPFFKRGPAPLVRLFFFASLSMALLIVDARFRYAEGLRSTLALVAYPLQKLATAPFDLAEAVGTYFTTQAQLREENAELRAKALAYSQNAQRYQAAEAEAAQLRRLIGATERVEVQATPAEVLYGSRDPYTHKVFIGKGAQQGIRAGSPVADENGLIGQVTRVHPLISEVTLLTDQESLFDLTKNPPMRLHVVGVRQLLEQRGVGHRDAQDPASDPADPVDVHATVYHCMGLDAEQTIHDQLRRPFPISTGRVIEALLA